MAKIGLNNFRYAVATVNETTGAISYSTVKKPGKAVSFNFEPTNSDAILYADDSLAETDNRVTGGTCTMGIDRLDAQTMAEILGHTYDNDTQEVVSNVNDIAPYIGVGRIVRIMVDGTQMFRATFFAQCKFSEPTSDDSTMGESVEFSTYELAGKVVVPANGNWRREKTFTSQRDAINYLEGLFSPSPSV
jgi:phi13 family phage major tail protein